MDLATHFRVIAQNWLRILVISLVLATVVFLVSSFRADEYQATETLSIRAGNTLNQSPQDAATFAAQVYAKYVETASFLSAVVRDSKLKLSLSEAGNRISASPVGDLGYLDVKATGPNRKDAETLARVAGGQLVTTIRSRVRAECSPRHTPAVVAAVDDLPRTRSNKLVELAVADAVHGRPVRNAEALANPEAIDAIVALPELAR